MNDRHDHGPYDHMHEPDHDPAVGAALRGIDDPPSAPDFWDRVDERIDEELGRAVAGDHDGLRSAGTEARDPGGPVTIELEELHEEVPLAAAVAADATSSSDLAELQVRRRRRRGVLAAAAAAAILVGGAVALQQLGSDGDGDADIATATDGGETELSERDDDSGQTAPEATGPATVVELPGAVTGIAEVSYDADPTITDLGDGTVVLAGSSSSDVLLISQVVDGTDGQGCEGFGPRSAVSAISSDATVNYGSLPGDGVGHHAVAGGADQFVLSQRCEGFVEPESVVSLTGSGVLPVGAPLVIPTEGNLIVVGTPVWSANGSRVLVNATDFDQNGVLLTYDAASAELLSTDTAPGAVVIAELIDGTSVTSKGLDVRVGAGEPVRLDDQEFFGPAQAVVSLDGELVAVWGGKTLVVLDASGQILSSHEAPGGFYSVAWSPTGHLAFAAVDSAQIVVERPSEPGSSVTVDVGAGDSPRWFGLAFTDGGRTLAVSGLGDEAAPARALRFPAAASTSGVDGSIGGPGIGAVTPAPVEEPAVGEEPDVDEPVGLTIGDQPLALRGMGVVQVGMTVAQAEAALGGPIEEYAGLETCTYGGVAGDPSTPRFMILFDEGEDFSTGTIVRIELLEGQQTLSGIGIGSTRDEVLAAYGANIVASPHNYTSDQGGEYLTYVPTDGVDAQFRLVMETLDDRVTQVRSGLLPAVEWVEGCA